MKTIFSERLTQCLKECPLSHEEIAKKIGVSSKGTITKYANGSIQNPGLSKIEALANVFGVNPAWLVGFSEEKDSKK